MKRFLVLWLAGATLIAAVLSRGNLPRLYPLSKRGITTCGIVTEIDMNNHDLVHYWYQVNGQTYSGVQQGGVDGELTAFSSDCRGYAVYYLPEAPGISCIGDPTHMLDNELISIALPMLMFPPLALLGWGWRYPAFRQWLKAGARAKS